jgi:hypothetical protein
VAAEVRLGDSRAVTAVEKIHELPLRRLAWRSSVLALAGLAAAGCLITVLVAGWNVDHEDHSQDRYLSSTRTLAGLRGEGHGVWLELRPLAGVGVIDARVESIRPDLPTVAGLGDWSVTCADREVYAVFGGPGAWQGSRAGATLAWTDGGTQQGMPVPAHAWPYCVLEATTAKGAFVRLYLELHR